MGAVLIALAVGMLAGDPHFAPWFPFLLLFQLFLALAACREFVTLLGGRRSPQSAMAYLGVTVLVLANWLQNSPACQPIFWTILAGILAGLVIGIFLYEMATFTDPGRSVERMALTAFIIAYLGLLPCFFAQIRWLTSDDQANSVRLALAAFVPKFCDIGAYFTGRSFGKHPMTPILSPKKTWEGAVGGLITAVLATIAIDRLAPSASPVLHANLLWEIAFGLSVGLIGMLGDLAESLIKRDCQSKDASAAVPGFGGVLDVVDAIIYSAPVSFLWFFLLK